MLEFYLMISDTAAILMNRLRQERHATRVKI